MLLEWKPVALWYICKQMCKWDAMPMTNCLSISLVIRKRMLADYLCVRLWQLNNGQRCARNFPFVAVSESLPLLTNVYSVINWRNTYWCTPHIQTPDYDGRIEGANTSSTAQLSKSNIWLTSIYTSHDDVADFYFPHCLPLTKVLWSHEK